MGSFVPGANSAVKAPVQCVVSVQRDSTGWVVKVSKRGNVHSALHVRPVISVWDAGLLTMVRVFPVRLVSTRATDDVWTALQATLPAQDPRPVSPALLVPSHLLYLAHVCLVLLANFPVLRPRFNVQLAQKATKTSLSVVRRAQSVLPGRDGRAQPLVNLALRELTVLTAESAPSAHPGRIQILVL